MRRGLRAMIITAVLIDLFYDLQSGYGVPQAGRGLPLQANVIQEFLHFHGPGVVRHRVFPDRGFRGTHFRKHAIPGESLEPVAAAESLDVQLAAAATDLEGKRVLPLGAARVQKGDLPGGRLQQKECVVIDGHVPEVGMGRAVHLHELPEEPTCEIDDVDTLIDQLAAAGNFRLSTPLPLVTKATAMAVAGAHKQERAQYARVYEVLGLADRAVV